MVDDSIHHPRSTATSTPKAGLEARLLAELRFPNVQLAILRIALEEHIETPILVDKGTANPLPMAFAFSILLDVEDDPVGSRGFGAGGCGVDVILHSLLTFLSS